MKTRNTFSAIIAACIILFSVPEFAGAHAFLEHADPKVGSTIAVSPKKITLTFTQEVEPAFSTVEVLDANAKPVDSHDAKVDSKDASIMTLSVPVLPPGIYKVEWKVTSVDTHKTHGSFTFTVKPKA
jgi:methionine-rich copper-binding protein CopC